MRVKLSEKYQIQREEICNKLIQILQLDDDNCFLLYELDNDIEKQSRILEMKNEIKKYFAVSNISVFKPKYDCKKPYINIIRSILRQQNYIVKNTQIEKSNGDGTFFRSTKYKIFRNN